jgi:hypothetical protein
MPDIDLNDEAVKAAITAEATKIANQTIEDNYVPVSDIEGLKNKNTELLTSLAKNKEKFAGLEEGDVVELLRIKEAREKDKFIDLIMTGKTEEARTLAAEGAVAPWKEQATDLRSQFETAQGKISEFEHEIKTRDSRIADMQKRQYLRELVAGDDSFKDDYFDDYYTLNAKFIDINSENGDVNAIDSVGKPILNTNGERVSFAEHYDKQKAKNGLFWTPGAGSTAKGVSGDGSHLGSDPSKWARQDKLDYIGKHGPAAYGALLQEAKK